jgi:hypothetical protein
MVRLTHVHLNDQIEMDETYLSDLEEGLFDRQVEKKAMIGIAAPLD